MDVYVYIYIFVCVSVGVDTTENPGSTREETGSSANKRGAEDAFFMRRKGVFQVGTIGEAR